MHPVITMEQSKIISPATFRLRHLYRCSTAAYRSKGDACGY
ncbi:hypothetical protein BBR47_12260 [Brevibacillus brevis NBRC 100599]|uniref:Uncharacterized protein n=1 Tax=Brevibacillus brevis (strain 47 / JCM 6285 / NBRC 100599) TaxID=358681 RepID=C0Z7G0_BREBN|nr:hypothetical protein BBR47_12260 [Brevibacillus brevis NBRC 100599]